MKRIFYLITELDIGGAEKSLCELVSHLDRRRFEPVVGCLTGNGPVGEWLEREGVEVVYFDMSAWWDVGAWRRLRRALKLFRPHIVHSYLFHANMAGRLAAIGLGVERVISSVRVEDPRPSHLWLDRLTRGLADRVTCVSESARRYTHKKTGMALNKLVVIHNGIDPARYDMPVMAAPEKWGIQAGALVVGVIGRLDRQKAPLLMLRAAERVLAEVPDAVFAFAGDGPLAEQCRAEAEARGIAGSVRWLGWQEDVRPLLARMDLLGLSSRWEGMPNVVLEAMACAKPVVATRVGGCGELVLDGQTGFLVPRNDEAAFAGRIVALLKDNKLRKDLGRMGRERVMEHFSVEKMVQGNEGLYEP